MTRKNYIDMAQRFGALLADTRFSEAEGIYRAIEAYIEHASDDSPAFDSSRFWLHVVNVRDVAVTERLHVAEVSQ
jgi:hypothetical protein